MRRILIRTFYLLLVVSASSCSSTIESQQNTRTLRLQSLEMKEAFLLHAEQEGLWLQDEEGTLIRFKNDDHSRVIELLHSFSNEYLPIGRSVSYAPRLQIIFRDELVRAGIPFRQRRHEGRPWIIWSEHDTEEVNKIQKRLKRIVIEQPELLEGY